MASTAFIQMQPHDYIEVTLENIENFKNEMLRKILKEPAVPGLTRVASNHDIMDFCAHFGIRVDLHTHLHSTQERYVQQCGEGKKFVIRFTCADEKSVGRMVYMRSKRLEIEDVEEVDEKEIDELRDELGDRPRQLRPKVDPKSRTFHRPRQGNLLGCTDHVRQSPRPLRTHRCAIRYPLCHEHGASYLRQAFTRRVERTSCSTQPWSLGPTARHCSRAWRSPCPRSQ